MKYTFLLVFALLFSVNSFAHNINEAHAPLRAWHLKNGCQIHASFLLMKGDSVCLEMENNTVQAFALADFDAADQGFFKAKMEAIERLNQPQASRVKSVQVVDFKSNFSGKFWLFWLGLLAFIALSAFVFFNKRPNLALGLCLSGTVFLLAFKTKVANALFNTDPQFLDAAFAPFKPHIATHWDNTWFYVESNGLPTTHSMMTGIAKWQQQVPIPQCYIGTNAWQIPLNPELASTPVPVNQQHFLRGAVAIAANGIPIFNPYTNTGVDALLDGQLDQWGGHSGRADDYHYHIAPMFLDTQTVDILPIAFGLDGFAVYASLEPDGSPMLPLDANHGHFDALGVYHYHGTPEAPYMIGKMVGKVTEDSTLQIIPQAKAMPVRPSLTPLNGAAITGFEPNGNGNGYNLTYTRTGETYHVNYSWTPTGVYTYQFIAPTVTTIETYNGHLPCQVTTAAGDMSNFENSVLVYPNPTSGTVLLRFNTEAFNDPTSVQVFDVQGKSVFQQEKLGAELQIGGIARGIYFLKIKSGKQEIYRKIAVQ